jgi:SulP family sulfate permease
LAAPLVSYVPLAALGAVLAVVAWNMAEKEEFVALLRSSRGDALVLLATFLLTVFHDLATGIAVGVVLASFLFLQRLAEAVEIEAGVPLASEDRADTADVRTQYDPQEAVSDDIRVFRISGAYFFATTARVSTILDRVGGAPRVFILDFSEVPLIDSTAAKALEAFVHKLRRSGTAVYFSGARHSVRRALIGAGLRRPLVLYSDSVETAKALAKA